MTISEAGRALRSGRISAEELTRESLDAISKSQAALNAYLTVTEESAIAAARAVDDQFARGIDHGPMQGIPIAHKDIIQTKGIRTTAGSKIFANHVPDADAYIVAKLHDAGAILTGKTNLHELCYGITSANPHFGAVRNPWDLGRLPGGSSGGSAAAVAAGIVPFATGTDTGGSVRIPASFCGVVGLKPTYNRISTRGIMPLGFTLDHAGPITRNVRDCAIAFQAMIDHGSGYVPPAGVDLEGVRIGLPKTFFFDRIDPKVMLSVRSAIQTAAALGAHLMEVDLPDAGTLNSVGRIIQLSEIATVWRRYMDRRGDFGADVLAGIDQGSLIPATDYLDAQRLRRVLARQFAEVWTQVDCLITPSTPTPAPKVGDATVEIGGLEEDVRLASTRLTRPFNTLGWPAISIPCGLTKGGLPIGLQLVAAPKQEDTLLEAAAALEDALGLKDFSPAAFRAVRP